MVSCDVNVKKTLQDLDLVKEIYTNQRKHRLFRTMAEILLKSYYAQTFYSEGARRGHDHWLPLNPLYVMYKAKKGRSTKPLIWDGHLQGSAQILEETDNTLKFGTQVPYAEYHQDGGKNGRPPQREFLFLTDEDMTEIDEFLATMVQSIINTSVRGGK